MSALCGKCKHKIKSIYSKDIDLNDFVCDEQFIAGILCRCSPYFCVKEETIKEIIG